MIDLEIAGSLVVLALIDSMSFGTLLIPIWLLMTPGRVRLGRILFFLGTVGVAYFGIGVVLIFTASMFVEAYGGLLSSQSFLIAQLGAGVALLVVSQLMDSKRARARAVERAAAGGGRVLRWRSRAMGGGENGSGSTLALAGLALTAVVVEVASMLPYLAAIGIMTATGVGWPGVGLILAGYCLVMIAPALVLMVGRITARQALERPLGAIEKWLTKHAQATTAWIIGIVGFLLAARAVYDLGWFGG